MSSGKRRQWHESTQGLWAELLGDGGEREGEGPADGKVRIQVCNRVLKSTLIPRMPRFFGIHTAPTALLLGK